MDNQNIQYLPNYKQIFQEIGKQLSNRKKDLVKRIFIILWPGLILILFLFFFKNLAQLFGAAIVFYFFIFWLTLVLIYMIIIRIILHTEKIIWIDSYFDGKNIDSKVSWRIAKKLFFPSLAMWMQIFFRFLLFPILMMFFFYFLFDIAPTTIKDFALIAYFIFSFIAIIYIYYYIRIKLRYIWFLFIDLYGTEGFSYKKLFQEMKKFNNINKQESFKKTLVLYFGSDTINTIVRSVSINIGEGLGRFGAGGILAGRLFRAISQETSRQVTSLAKITVNCLFYRTAKSNLYNNPQKVNEYIYNLIEEV